MARRAEDAARRLPAAPAEAPSPAEDWGEAAEFRAVAPPVMSFGQGRRRGSHFRANPGRGLIRRVIVVLVVLALLRVASWPVASPPTASVRARAVAVVPAAWVWGSVTVAVLALVVAIPVAAVVFSRGDNRRESQTGLVLSDQQLRGRESSPSRASAAIRSATSGRHRRSVRTSMRSRRRSTSWSTPSSTAALAGAARCRADSPIARAPRPSPTTSSPSPVAEPPPPCRIGSAWGRRGRTVSHIASGSVIRRVGPAGTTGPAPHRCAV